MRPLVIIGVRLLLATSRRVVAQDRAARPLIIDMHLHANTLRQFGSPSPSVCTNDQEIVLPGWDPRQPLRLEGNNEAISCPVRLKAPATDNELLAETLHYLDRNNNIRAVTSGPLDQVTKWRAAAPDRIIPAIAFAENKDEKPEMFRQLYRDGKFAVFAEVGPQYQGVSIGNPSYEPYFALAEELDIPVGIHMGEGPPGGRNLQGYSAYRVQMGNPLLLEDVLVRHPKLRIYVMHYGSPLVDDMIALLYSYPQVYVDVAQNDWGFPRKHFYSQLRRLVDAGFGKRIMFGSDEMIWPETIRIAVETIESADFLSHEQKRDIFCRNAARFLRLDGNSCD
jgi:predicted TIM-barrel fold metal-dependent hydrolase